MKIVSNEEIISEIKKLRKEHKSWRRVSKILDVPRTSILYAVSSGFVSDTLASRFGFRPANLFIKDSDLTPYV